MIQEGKPATIPDFSPEAWTIELNLEPTYQLQPAHDSAIINGIFNLTTQTIHQLHVLNNPLAAQELADHAYDILLGYDEDLAELIRQQTCDLLSQAGRSEDILSETKPDYVASHWLRFHGVKPVQGDPTIPAQFVATHSCLAAVTNYVAAAARPGFVATPEDIAKLHREFVEWSVRYNRTSQETGEGLLTSDISLQNLLALSTRRLNALDEFGGEGREEYILFLHVHDLIRSAAELPQDR